MPRKTVHVSTVRDTANVVLALPDTEGCGVRGTCPHPAGVSTPEENRARRMGVIIMVESVLHSTDTYRGFQYLASEFLPVEEQTAVESLKADYDDTRRRYF